jgi:hypothetical protein
MNIVVAYRGISHAPGRETGAALARAFRRLGHPVYEYGNYYQTPCRINESKIPFEPELLVYCECNDDDPQYKELKSLRVQHRIYWDFDISTHPVRTLLFIWRMNFNLIFYANKLYEASFKRICPHSYFLPYAIDDEFHRKIPATQKTIDIGLIGSPYPARIALIETLNRAGLKAQLFNGVYGEDMVRLVNGFKIQLNYNTSKTRGLLVGRVWETTGCGTLLLTQHEDFIELFFENDKQVVMYCDIVDCITKARELLADDKKREMIAQNGFMLVHKNHTYLNRAKSIIDTLSQPGRIDKKHSQFLAIGWEIICSAYHEGIRSKSSGM